MRFLLVGLLYAHGALHILGFLKWSKLAELLTPWSVSCSEWRTLDGVEIPVTGDVSWKLASGDFSYYQWELVEVEYNRAELYTASATSFGN